ncbi:unnamed protein product [Angiostrongylus costaricensis]|uniref:SSD domain-containing protein n=1 Tax=Angiostrongylus costaricensis TaxID=334426 RepID=A0A158PEM4_ANGCS|nr:unnamed protein product [Angiostrongylus costaricensis]
MLTRVSENQSHRKLPRFSRNFSLHGLFYLLGKSVATYPYAYLLVGALICMNSGGMYWMNLRDRIRDGYTPVNAPSRYETDVMREFWNSTSDPMMTIVLLLARDQGSMHRKPHLDEAERLVDFLYTNFTVDHKGTKLRFKNLCSPYCNMNEVFKTFKSAFDVQYSHAVNNESLSTHIQLKYPVAKYFGISLHLERCFFGVRLKVFVENSTQLYLSYIVVTIFASWEIAAYEWSVEYNSCSNESDSLVEIQMRINVIGTEILDMEMIRDTRKITPFFAAGFAFMITFVSVCVFCSALYYNALDAGKILVGVGATFCPIIAITCSYGIVSMLGCRVNSFMLVMPFLIMGIGVDDSFLMIHTWQRMIRDGYNVKERLGMVYEHVGPSITITSLTNFLSFGIGAYTPTPEIRLFCFATALAMALTFIFQLIVFGPILAIATGFEKAGTVEEHSSWRNVLDASSNKLLHYYCCLLGHKVFISFVVAATFVYWYFAIIGILEIKTRLDTVKILPKNSPLQRPNYILSNIVWAEYHAVTVVISTPFDVTNKTHTTLFWDMIHNFETLPHSKGSSSSLIWLRDYIDYYYNGDPANIISVFLRRDDINPYLANITLNKLNDFLESKVYRHWEAFMRIRNYNDAPIVERFWLTVAYENTSQWETLLVANCSINQYPDLNASVWEPNGMFVDQMLSLKSGALQTSVLTLACMAVVCALFIPNPCSVITAGISIASISLGVIGFLSIWKFDLDPVVMAALLMSIGMSVDFIAHVAYHYQLTVRKEFRDGRVVKIPVRGPQQKLEHTLRSVGWPMLQAAISTVCCTLPLLLLASYSPSVFVTAIFLVVTWGALHGLVVLPSFLGCLPDYLTNGNCCRTFISPSSKRSCRYSEYSHESMRRM